MIDLTTELRTAKQAGRWPKERFHGLGESLAQRIGRGRWDWDDGAGEDWGAILTRHGELATQLWRLGAFAFVHVLHGARVVDEMRELGMTCVIVRDWDSDDYSVSAQDWPEIFEQEIPGGPAVDPAGISANDLCWATI